MVRGDRVSEVEEGVVGSNVKSRVDLCYNKEKVLYLGMLSAGEIWSVVTEPPRWRRAR